MFEPTVNPPKVFLNKDFIGVWDNLMLDDFNNHVIDILDNSSQIVPRSNTSVKDSQLDIAAFNPTISNSNILETISGFKTKITTDAINDLYQKYEKYILKIS